MSYGVTKGDRNSQGAYEVRGLAPHSDVQGIVKTFKAETTRFIPGTGHVVETEDQVRARAQAFAQRVNAGGAARERALRAARRRGEVG